MAHNNVLMFAPPLITTVEEIDRLVEVVASGVKSIGQQMALSMEY